MKTFRAQFVLGVCLLPLGLQAQPYDHGAEMEAMDYHGGTGSFPDLATTGLVLAVALGMYVLWALVLAWRESPAAQDSYPTDQEAPPVPQGEPSALRQSPRPGRPLSPWVPAQAGDEDKSLV